MSICSSSHVAETSAVALIAELVGPCRVREQSVEGRWWLLRRLKLLPLLQFPGGRPGAHHLGRAPRQPHALHGEPHPRALPCTLSPCPPWTSGGRGAVSVTLRHKPSVCLSNCVRVTQARESSASICFLFVCFYSGLHYPVVFLGSGDSSA